MRGCEMGNLRLSVLHFDLVDLASYLVFVGFYRADAALVVGKDQSLRGIITDTDVTRRVISKGLDPDTTRWAPS